MLYRKIVVATSLLIVLLMLYLLPENNTIKFKGTNISYSYSNKLKPVFLLDSNNYISRVMIPISSSSKTDIAYEMIEILTIGGKYEDKLKNGFRSLIPSIVNVKSIKGMFFRCHSLISIPNISIWKTINLLDMSDAFPYAIH